MEIFISLGWGYISSRHFSWQPLMHPGIFFVCNPYHPSYGPTNDFSEYRVASSGLEIPVGFGGIA